MKKIIFTIIMLVAVCCITAACVTDNDDMRPQGPDTTGGTTGAPIMTTPSANPVSSPQASPTSGLSGIGDAIEDFVEGTIVDIESVPEVVRAGEDKYEGADVKSITHATHLNEQVYEVKYTDKNGTTHTVYVSPDGKTVTEATDTEASPSPSVSPT